MHLPILNFRLPFIRIENTQLAPSENRSHKSADGRVATEAAWLNGKMEEITERAEKTLDRDRPSHGRSCPSVSRTACMPARAFGYTGAAAEIRNWWLRNDPPNAAWKKLSARVYCCASTPSGKLVASK